MKNNQTTIELQRTPDPFDPAALRLGQDFAENLGAKKAIVTIPRRKPGAQEFIRIHPDEDMRIVANTLEWQEDRELYLVHPSVAPVIGKEVKPRKIIPTMTATGNFFIWAMKITPEGERENTWNMSANAAAEKAILQWVNLSSNQSANAYDVRIAEGVIPDPEWPDLTLRQILELAFKDRFIQSLDHPVVKKLKGVL